MDTQDKSKSKTERRDKKYPGYPRHGAKEDIYSNEKELENQDLDKPDTPKKDAALNEDKDVKPADPVEFIDSGNTPGSQAAPHKSGTDSESEEQKNEIKPGDTEMTYSRGRRAGEDLDVPGAELDDAQEKRGAEDEENNYYSLGGDRHE